MFAIVSGALTSAISRYITYELGKNNPERLHKIFSTSVYIQIFISLIVLVIGELFSIWFINYKMTVPPEMIQPTVWVLQFSLITFCINLISVPYNAAIIAHERMMAFAYISILQALLNLGICFLLLVTPFSRLVTYAVLVMSVALVIRIIYSVYCHKNFEECKGRMVFDKSLFKEMLSFSSWSFFTNTSTIANNQGITMLLNVFFGLTVNAARGLATQVETAVISFVNSFTTSINPQITKSYAAGEKEEMYKLVCRGAKFSVLSMFLFMIPLIFEMKTVLHFWLGDVPEHTLIFSQLSLIIGMFDCLGLTAYTACMANGNIKKYVLIITPLGYLDFIITWIIFYFGAPAVATYWVYIGVKAVINIARVILLKEMVGLPVKMYAKEVYLPLFLVALTAVVPPLIFTIIINETFIRIFGTTILSIVSVCSATYFVGLNKDEKKLVTEGLMARIHR